MDDLNKLKQMNQNNMSTEIYLLSRERKRIPFRLNISKIYDNSGDFTDYLSDVWGFETYTTDKCYVVKIHFVATI